MRPVGASRWPPALPRLGGGAPDYRGLFGLFVEAGANTERATGLLAESMRKWPDGDARHELLLCEQKGDRITHDIIHHLHTKGVTPFDREDVLSLASELDDVVDFAEEVGDFLHLYSVEAPTDQAIQLCDVLRDAGREIDTALQSLNALAELRPHIIELNRLEDEGDRIEREALAALFKGGIDPMVVIRWKDIYERIEQAIDSSEHVANVLEGIVVKHG
jgi:uncharacterized protein